MVTCVGGERRIPSLCLGVGSAVLCAHGVKKPRAVGVWLRAPADVRVREETAFDNDLAQTGVSKANLVQKSSGRHPPTAWTAAWCVCRLAPPPAPAPLP